MAPAPQPHIAPALYKCTDAIHRVSRPPYPASDISPYPASDISPYHQSDIPIIIPSNNLQIAAIPHHHHKIEILLKNSQRLPIAVAKNSIVFGYIQKFENTAARNR